MKNMDTALLATNLNALAEVFDKKPVSLKAVEVWYDTLKDFPTELVMGILIGWPKSHVKFPAPAEVWKTCNDIGIRGREEKAEAERKVDTVAAFKQSARGRECLAQMKAILARPKRTGKAYWRWVLENSEPGTHAHDAAREVLGPQVERVPGEDDDRIAA